MSTPRITVPGRATSSSTRSNLARTASASNPTSSTVAGTPSASNTSNTPNHLNHSTSSNASSSNVFHFTPSSTRPLALKRTSSALAMTPGTVTPATSTPLGSSTGVTPGTMRTPANGTTPRGVPLTARSLKRDTLAAELERDPSLAPPKRTQRRTLLASTLSAAGTERELAHATTSLHAAESALRASEAKVGALEVDRRYLAEREEEERKGREEEGKRAAEEIASLRHQLSTLRTAYSTLQSTHADLSDTHSTLLRSSSHSSSSHASQLAQKDAEIASLSAALHESQTHGLEQAEELAAVSAQLEEAQTALQNSHRSNRDDADSATLRSELARQAAYTRTLEASQVRLESELSKLRKKEGVVGVVEEKLRGAERKVEHMSARVGELEGEKVKLARELREVKKVLERTQNMGGGAGDASFASMKDDVSDISAVDASTTAALSRLRLQHATLLDELSTARATLSASNAHLSSLSAQLEETKKEAEEKTTELESEKEGKRRMERRVRDVEGEVEFLRAMVVSYQQEQQQVQQPPDGGLATPSGLDGTANSAHIAALTTQLTHLTSLTASLQASNKDLHAELDAMSAKVKGKETTGEQVRELKAELDNLRSRTLEAETELSASQTELADLTAQLEAAEQRLFELTGAIAAGTHVPPGVRVLSMAGNPAQKWAEERKEAVERLRRENEALLGRVKVLEDQLEGAGGVRAGAAMANAATGGPHEDLVPRESWAAEREERERLEDVVKQREKRLVRLQDIFKAKSAEFREAIAAVLGVKLAFYPNGQVRVTSVYDLNASFVFQPGKTSAAARMQLVASSEHPPQDVEQWLRVWVEQESSIPGLMATVTLDAFERWKAGESEGVDGWE